MYGAILGDIVGKPYEHHFKMKNKVFPLFVPASRFSDDSVMTIAIADGLLRVPKDASLDEIRSSVVHSMQYWGQKYPHAGYGGRFRYWLYEEDPHPYRSFGNGSAMRVSPVGWLYDTIERTRAVAAATADVTHNHPEGIKGAEAAASVVFMARHHASKEEIKAYVEQNFGYDLNRTVAEIRPVYQSDSSCQGTVPEAIIAFLEGITFEDVLRTAVSLGGDCDTLTSIASAMAEAYYGVPTQLKEEVRRRIQPDMLEVVDRFDRKLGRSTLQQAEDHASFPESSSDFLN